MFLTVWRNLMICLHFHFSFWLLDSTAKNLHWKYHKQSFIQCSPRLRWHHNLVYSDECIGVLTAVMHSFQLS